MEEIASKNHHKLAFKLSDEQIERTKHIKVLIGIPIKLPDEVAILIIDSLTPGQNSGLLDSNFLAKAKRIKEIIGTVLSTQSLSD